MFKKFFSNFLFLSFSAILLLSVACTNAVSPKPSLDQTASSYNTPLYLGSASLLVEVASTDEARAQGLSGRESLTDNQGMLFDFRGTGMDRPGFWMKDMKFALDLIWINNNQVVGITPGVPAPVPGSADLPSYFPPSPIDSALEVNAGWSETYNIKVGDRVEWTAK